MKKQLLVCLFLLPVLLSAQLEWIQLGDPAGTTIKEVLAGPVSHIFLQTAGDQLYRSANDGDSWERLPLPDVDNPILDWTVGADDVLYLYKYGAVYKLTTDNNNWTLMTGDFMGLSPLQNLFVYPDGSLMLVGRHGTMAYREIGTEDWVTRYSVIPGSSASQVVLGDEGYYYLFNSTTIRRFSRTGTPYVEIPRPSTSTLVQDVNSHPELGLWVLQGNSLYRSNNHGDDWTEVAIPGITGTTKVGFGHSGAIYLYNPTRDRCYKSSDLGASWEAQEDLLAESAFGMTPVPLTSGADLFYNAGCGQSALLKSTDGGSTYENLSHNITQPRIESLSGRLEGQLFTKTCGLDWQVTEDGGANWAPFRMEDQPVQFLNTGPAGELIAATYTQEFYTSLDGGSSWNAIALSNPWGDFYSALQYLADDKVIISGPSVAIHYSTNGGNTFQRFTSSSTWLQDEVWYHPEGYFFTLNHPSVAGTRFERMDIEANDGSQLFDVPFAEMDPLQLLITTDNSILYVGLAAGETTTTKVFRSDDLGVTFSEVLAVPSPWPLPRTNRFHLVNDLAGNIYLLNDDEIFVSTDQGISWEVLLNNLPGTGQAGIYIGKDNYLYLIRYDGEIYRLSEPFFIPTGTDNRLSNGEIQVSPNPATDQLNILLKDGHVAPFSVVMYNTQGQALLRQEMTQKNNELNVSGLPKGLYFLQIEQSGKQVEVLKVVIQ